MMKPMSKNATSLHLIGKTRQIKRIKLVLDTIVSIAALAAAVVSQPTCGTQLRLALGSLVSS